MYIIGKYKKYISMYSTIWNEDHFGPIESHYTITTII